DFCPIFAPSMATMGQKSSLLQLSQSVSWALMPDIGGRLGFQKDEPFAGRRHMNEGLFRRDFLAGGGAAAGMALLQSTASAQTGSADRVVPWVDQPAPVPAAAAAIKAQTPWEQLDGWITPNEKFFAIAHYNVPALDEKNWRLDVTGLVAKPLTLTFKDLKALRRREITSTIECSGNNGLPFLTSAVGNAKWAGASL